MTYMRILLLRKELRNVVCRSTRYMLTLENVVHRASVKQVLTNQLGYTVSCFVSVCFVHGAVIDDFR